MGPRAVSLGRGPLGWGAVPLGLLGASVVACPAERYQRPALPAPRYEVAPVAPWDAGAPRLEDPLGGNISPPEQQLETSPAISSPESKAAAAAQSPDGGRTAGPELGMAEEGSLEP
jgi:hypothetical protein